MKRRAFVAAVVLSVTSLVVEAQPTARVPRIGLLSPEPLPGERDAIFLKRLSELGWIEGKNILIERRSAQNNPARLPELAKELVQSKVDAIVAITTQAVSAAKNATRTIPIVMAPAGDAFGSRFVANLARPEGNITGVTFTHETKPAELPVQQPTRFDMVLNMKTAKAQGITFPPAVLARADRVIE